MNADEDKVPPELRETYRRLGAAYRGDTLRARVRHVVPSGPRSTRSRYGWWAAVAALVVLAILLPRFLSPSTGPETVTRSVEPLHVPPGPVTRFDGVPVESLAALLATQGVELSQPRAVYFGRVSWKTFDRLHGAGPQFLRLTTPPLFRPLTVVVVAGHTIAGWAPYSPGDFSYGGSFHAAGVGIAVYTQDGRLVGSLNVGPMSIRHLRRLGWHLRPVFWPKDWRHRLWAEPWWPPGELGKRAGPDAGGSAAVVISVAEARALHGPSGGEASSIFPGLPVNGPVWLVETPSGKAWLIDGTTGAWTRIHAATGWFPLAHYGRPVPAAPLPLPRALSKEGAIG